MTVVLWFMTAVAIGMFTAGIAQWKGRRPLVWFLFGAMFGIVAIPALIMMERRESGRSRTPLIWFLGAAIVITLTGMIFIYRLQNAGII